MKARGVLRWAAGLGLAAVVLSTWLWALAFTNIYRQPVTRLAAARWIYEHVPTGATLLYDGPDGPGEVQVPLPKSDYAQDGARSLSFFEMPVDGVATAIRMNQLPDPQLDAGPEHFRVALAQTDDSDELAIEQPNP